MGLVISYLIYWDVWDQGEVKGPGMIGGGSEDLQHPRIPPDKTYRSKITISVTVKHGQKVTGS